MSNNDIDLIVKTGRLGHEPEVRNNPDGSKVCNFSLAQKKDYFDKSKEQWVNKTHWAKLVIWNEKAEAFVKECRKGDKIFIQGSSLTSNFTKADGTKVEQDVVIVSQFQNLDRLSEKTEKRLDEKVNLMADTMRDMEKNPGRYDNQS